MIFEIGNIYTIESSLRLSKWNGKKLETVEEPYNEICLCIKQLTTKEEKPSWILKTLESDHHIMTTGSVTRVFEHDDKWSWYGDKTTHPELYL